MFRSHPYPAAAVLTIAIVRRYTSISAPHHMATRLSDGHGATRFLGKVIHSAAGPPRKIAPIPCHYCGEPVQLAPSTAALRKRIVCSSPTCLSKARTAAQLARYADRHVTVHCFACAKPISVTKAATTRQKRFACPDRAECKRTLAAARRYRSGSGDTRALLPSQMGTSRHTPRWAPEYEDPED